MRQLRIEPAGQDQDPDYTSYAWTGRLLLPDYLQVSYLLDGARGNNEMEAFIIRFKNENRSLLLDASTIEALERVANVRMRTITRSAGTLRWTTSRRVNGWSAG